MRIVDVILTLPWLIVTFCIVSILGSSIFNALIALLYEAALSFLGIMPAAASKAT
jgi:ABC-type antimicrobial peptide transport system permease subunit